MVSELVDEFYSEQLYHAEKKGATDKMIDEASDFMDVMLSKINAAKTKKDFPKIYQEMEEKEDYFIGELSNI